MSTLKDIDRNESSMSSRSVAQLEHVLFEYERNLGVFLKSLSDERSPSKLSVKERQFVATKCEFYMSRAESVKAVIAAKKDARDVEQTRRRNSDIARERARAKSLQEEVRLLRVAASHIIYVVSNSALDEAAAFGRQEGGIEAQGLWRQPGI